MKVTIRGITPSTIAFNTLGIVIRGDNNTPELYPESIAIHIDVVNEDQLTEVNSLVNAGLIAVEVEEGETQSAPKVTPKDLVATDAAPIPIPVPSAPEAPVEAPETDDEVEDAPAPEATAEEQEEEEKPKSRGRPKGSKDKKPRKNSKSKSASKKAVKKVVKPASPDDEETTVIVMTPDGAKTGKMYRSAAGDIDDSEQTRASLEAMKKIEEEEEFDANLPDDVVDESKLSPEERMGGEAVVGGETGAEKVAMQNSIVPEAQQIKDRAVEFIDQADKDADEAAKQSFVDKKEKSEKDDLDFLEY